MQTHSTIRASLKDLIVQMATKRISKKPRRKNSWLSRLLKRRTETVTPSPAHQDHSSHALFKKGEVVDLNFDNYKEFISDPDKDVIVEFYDDRVFLFHSSEN